MTRHRTVLLVSTDFTMLSRVREHRERPEALENLAQSLNHSTSFLEKSRWVTGVLLVADLLGVPYPALTWGRITGKNLKHVYILS